jgi:hypothetical protein
MMNNFDALVTIVFDPVAISGEGDSREDHTFTVDANVWTTLFSLGFDLVARVPVAVIVTLVHSASSRM